MIATLTTMSQTQRLAFTGQPGIMVKDTDLNRVFVMHGITPGGIPLDNGPSLIGPTKIAPSTEISYTISGLDAWAAVTVTSTDGTVTIVDREHFTFTASVLGVVQIDITVDGRVYDYILNAVSDSLSGTVTNLATGPSPRTQGAGAATEDAFYVLGGNSNGTDSSFWKYEISTNTWVELDPGPTERYFASAAVLDNFLYMLGGRLIYGDHTNEFWAYDLTTQLWTELAEPIRTGSGAGLTSDGTYLYASSGLDAGGHHATFQRYDPSNDTWLELTSAPSTHTYVPVSHSNGKIYKYGGYNGGYRSDIDVYDIATDTWETKSGGPSGRHAFLGGMVGNRFYVFGGHIGSSSSRTGELWEYNVDTDSWQEIQTTAVAVQYGAGAITGNALYSFSGYPDGSGKLDLFFKIT